MLRRQGREGRGTDEHQGQGERRERGNSRQVNQERCSEGGRTLAIFERGEDLRSRGRTFKEAQTMQTKAQGKMC